MLFSLVKGWITCFLLSLKTGSSSASYNIHHYSTTSSTKGHLHKKSFRTNNFEKVSVTVSATDSWNKIQDQIGEIALTLALKDLRPSKIKDAEAT